MRAPAQFLILRVYLQNADRAPHTPTFERIVQEARNQGLLGATVCRGIRGAGHHGQQRQSVWSLTSHVPVVVELIDHAAQIESFLRNSLDQIMIGGMLTLDQSAVLHHHPPIQRSPASDSSTAEIDLNSIQIGPHMSEQKNGVMLRVFLGESDRVGRTPMHEAILQKARELGVAGATVFRGIEGFGATSVVHKAALLEMSTDLPIVVEIVDSQAAVDSLLPHVQSMVQGGMITVQPVRILYYRHASTSEQPEKTP